MSSADFANFGATALGVAGTAAIVGEEMKMLRHATKGGGPHKCRHCGSMYSSKSELAHHYKMHHKGHGTKSHERVASRREDWEFDFRI